MVADDVNEPKLLNWRQACELLKCGRTFFYRLVHLDILPAYRLGARKGVRVKREDCLKYLEGRKDI